MAAISWRMLRILYSRGCGKAKSTSYDGHSPDDDGDDDDNDDECGAVGEIRFGRET
jgi:hypothetical protein